jgi:hypothetical protein
MYNVVKSKADTNIINHGHQACRTGQKNSLRNLQV